MSKTGKKYQKYSAEFKLCVIMDMREHHLGLLETVMKYWDVPYILILMKLLKENFRNVFILTILIFLKD